MYTAMSGSRNVIGPENAVHPFVYGNRNQTRIPLSHLSDLPLPVEKVTQSFTSTLNSLVLPLSDFVMQPPPSMSPRDTMANDNIKMAALSAPVTSHLQKNDYQESPMLSSYPGLLDLSILDDPRMMMLPLSSATTTTAAIDQQKYRPTRHDSTESVLRSDTFFSAEDEALMASLKSFATNSSSSNSGSSGPLSMPAKFGQNGFMSSVDQRPIAYPALPPTQQQHQQHQTQPTQHALSIKQQNQQQPAAVQNVSKDGAYTSLLNSPLSLEDVIMQASLKISPPVPVPQTPISDVVMSNFQQQQFTSDIAAMKMQVSQMSPVSEQARRPSLQSNSSDESAVFMVKHVISQKLQEIAQLLSASEIELDSHTRIIEDLQIIQRMVAKHQCDMDDDFDRLMAANDRPRRSSDLCELSREELINKCLEYEHQIIEYEESNASALTERSSNAGHHHSERCRWAGCTTPQDMIDNLTNHITENHVDSNSQGGFVCLWENCIRRGVPFTKKSRMISHLTIHTGEKRFKCPIEGCVKRFSRQDAMNTHVKTHSMVRPHTCECGRSFYNIRSYRRHEKLHHNSENSCSYTAASSQQPKSISDDLIAVPFPPPSADNQIFAIPTSMGFDSSFTKGLGISDVLMKLGN
eukprot:Partr_v1_DN28803_c0_g1_i1_m33398 putative Transcription factor